MRKIILFYIFPLLMLAACAGNERNKDLDNVKALRKEFKDKTDNKSAIRMDSAIKAFITKYPNDSVCAEMLYADAYEVQFGYLKKNDAGMQLLGQLVDKFPKFSRAPQVLYTIAFIFEDTYKNTNMARAKYELLIKSYPNSPEAKESEHRLKFLGKSAADELEQVRAEYEKKQADSAKAKSAK